jgi:beta-lactamase class A
MRLPLCFLALAIITSAAPNSFSQSLALLPSTVDDKPAPKLDDQVKALVASFKGKVTLYAKNLDTGETYALNADERVRTASTIKIAVMIEAFARVNEGKAKWTDQVVLTKEKKVSGSGILSELSDGLHLTLRDAVNLMMMLSDNTATNLVLDVLTTDAVNARMESLAFKNIKINRKVMSGGESQAGKDPENKKYGLGFATPHEMVLVMEKTGTRARSSALRFRRK